MSPDEIREAAIEVVSDLLIDGPDYIAVSEWGEEDGWSDEDTYRVYEMTKEICSELRGSLS